MHVFKNKKGFIGMYSDVIKGLVIGLIVGIILMIVLLMMNILPFLSNMVCKCG